MLTGGVITAAAGLVRSNVRLLFTYERLEPPTPVKFTVAAAVVDGGKEAVTVADVFTVEQGEVRNTRAAPAPSVTTDPADRNPEPAVSAVFTVLPEAGLPPLKSTALKQYLLFPSAGFEPGAAVAQS
jgi:hypothetical protein